MPFDHTFDVQFAEGRQQLGWRRTNLPDQDVLADRGGAQQIEDMICHIGRLSLWTV